MAATLRRPLDLPALRSRWRRRGAAGPSSAPSATALPDDVRDGSAAATRNYRVLSLGDDGLSDAFGAELLEDGLNVLVLLRCTSTPPWDAEERRQRETLVAHLQPLVSEWKGAHAVEVIRRISEDWPALYCHAGVPLDAFMRQALEHANLHSTSAAQQFCSMAMSIRDSPDETLLYDRIKRLYAFYEAKSIADTLSAAACVLVQLACSRMWEEFSLECLEPGRRARDVHTACRAIDTLFTRVPRVVIVDDADGRQATDVVLRCERAMSAMQRAWRVRWYRTHDWLHRMNHLGLSSWQETWRDELKRMGASNSEIRRGIERLCAGLNGVVQSSIAMGRKQNNMMSHEYAHLAWQLTPRSEAVARR